MCSWPCLRIRFRKHAQRHTHTRLGRVWQEVIIIPTAAGHPLGREGCWSVCGTQHCFNPTAASQKAAGPLFSFFPNLTLTGPSHCTHEVSVTSERSHLHPQRSACASLGEALLGPRGGTTFPPASPATLLS